MLVAYFDESGTHGEEAEVTTVAGFIGDTIEWNRLEPLWKKRLGTISSFHATDCQAKDGEFISFDTDQSRSLFVDLAKIIADRRLIAVAGSVYKDDWNYAATPAMKKHFTSRFHQSLILAFLWTLKIVGENAPDECVAFVLARHDEYNDFAEALHSALSGNRNLGSLTFCDPQHLAPLQAADLYAFETYRELLRQSKEERGLIEPKREAYRIIHAALPDENRIVDIDTLNAMAFEEVLLGIK